MDLICNYILYAVGHFFGMHVADYVHANENVLKLFYFREQEDCGMFRALGKKICV